jgi:hypothetical protein
MAVRRMRARVAVVGLGVLVSMALTAAPSWARNSTNAALCEAGGYPGVLLAQDGSAFKNAGACTKYAAKGGQLAGVDAVAQPASAGEFSASYSGFGLEPGSIVFVGARYQPSGISAGLFEGVAGNGTFSVTEQFTCEEPGGPGNKVGTVDLEAITAAGTVFIREFAPPSGC